MKSFFISICAAAVFCTAVAVSAAEVKVNDKAFQAKGKNFSKIYVFSTLDKADPELQLTAKNMYQHPRHKNIAGMLSDLTLKITSSNPVKSFKSYANICNYADRKERTYVTEYSLDNKTWKEISTIKKAGGWAACNSKDVKLSDNTRTFYLRFRKVIAPNDTNGLKHGVVFKKVGFTLNF